MSYIFVSPHIDDAILSQGGYISEIRKNHGTVVIIYVFSISNWSNRQNLSGLDYGDEQVYITEIRKKEENKVVALLGHTCHFLDFLDAPLREKVIGGNGFELKAQIKERVLGIIDKKDHCFFPVGLIHPDHILTREIGNELLEENYGIRFFEDLPYAAWLDLSPDNFYEALYNTGLKPEILGIDFARKSELMACYCSQVSPGWVNDIRNYSYSLSANKYFERFWRPLAR